MTNIAPPSPLAYEGQVAIPYINRTFDPNSTNYQFQVPTIWINTATDLAWILVSKPQNVANWLLFTGGSGATIQVDTPDGAMVQPLVGIINFLNGTGMNITGSGNNITFNSTGGFSWIDVTAATQTLAAGEAYLADRGTLITFSLPVTAAFGDTYIIAGYGAGGWTLAQQAGQSIIVGPLTSTVGVTGGIASIISSDLVEIVCVVADTTFKVVNIEGNIQVT